MEQHKITKYRHLSMMKVSIFEGKQTIRLYNNGIMTLSFWEKNLVNIEDFLKQKNVSYQINMIRTGGGNGIYYTITIKEKTFVSFEEVVKFFKNQ